MIDEDGTWVNGNEYVSFVTLMGLRPGNAGDFISTYPAYSPGGGVRAYGGHVYAQSGWAAAQTVKKGFVLHSITGHFTLQGMTNIPFHYTIRTIRDGGSYCQRQVDVWQHKADTPPNKNDVVCFTAVCSFKRDEPNVDELQHPARLRERFGVAIGERRPEEFEECPGVDSPWYWDVEKQYGKDKFPGLKMTTPDMAAYNDPRPPLERRVLQWYSVLGDDMPSVEDEPNLHVAAHLYASDRNGLFAIPNLTGRGNNYTAMASLSHTVYIQTQPREFSMLDPLTKKPRWFVQELQMDRVGYGRGMVSSKLWREDGGVHVGSHVQDGLLRMPPAGEKAGLEDGLVIFKGEEKGKL